MAIAITLCGFIDLGRSVSPIFLSMGHILFQFSTFYEKMRVYRVEVWLVFHTPYLWNEASDPQIYFISETSKSLSVRSRSFKKFYRVENFRANRPQVKITGSCGLKKMMTSLTNARLQMKCYEFADLAQSVHTWKHSLPYFYLL